MRIERIEARNFLCHRRLALDIGHLNLFAITGPTGAGKTALTDIITCALFGSVPRMGKSGERELIRKGATTAEVAVEFSLGDGRRFRAEREFRKSRTLAKLYEIDPLGIHPPQTLAGSARDVPGKVTEVIGLDYDSFITCVLLPQNQFSAFLKASRASRQNILRRLLNIQYLERIRDRAAKRRDDLTAQVAAIEHRLGADDIQSATPETLAALTRQRSETQQHLDAEIAEHRELAALVARETQTLDAKRRLVDAEKNLAALATDRPKLEALADAIDAAERAGNVKAALDAADRAAQEAADRAKQKAAATTELEAAREQLSRVQQSATRAQTRATAELAAIDAELTALAAARPDIERRQRAVAELSAARAKLADAQKSATASEKKVTDLEQEIAAAKQSLAEIDTELVAIAEVADRASRLDTALSAVRDMAKLAGELCALANATRAEQRERDLLGETVADLEAAAEAAQKAVAEADEDREDARVTLAMAEREHAAIFLRQHLADGDACPVCGSLDHPHGADHAPTSTDAERLREIRDLERAVKAADAAAREAAKESAGVRESLASAHATIKAQITRANEAAFKAESAAAALTEAIAVCQELVVALDNAVWKTFTAKSSRDDFESETGDWEKWGKAVVTASGDLDAGLKAAWNAALAATKMRSTLEKQRADAERTVLRAGELATEKNLLVERRAAFEAVFSGISALEIEVAALDETIASVTGNVNPDVRHTELTEARAAMLAALEAARGGLSRAERTCEIAESKLAGADSEHSRAVAELVAREKTLQAELAANGFANVSTARQAAVVPDELRDWRAEHRTLSGKLLAASTAVDTAREELGDANCDPAAHAAHVERLRELESTLETRRAELADLRGATHRLERTLQSIGAMQNELRLTREAADVYTTIVRDFERDHLPTYIVEETVAQLARDASRQLRLLTDRYDLVVSDGQFCVVDLFNAGEMRPATTLSGGETFLASLALALALADSVREIAGTMGVRLNCLFLDEGFGALDAESVEIAVAALEELQARSDRQIGVISHIEALNARLPGRVQIDREGFAEPKVTVSG